MKVKYDFHIHSCLSPCGDGEMTPANIVNMAKLLGLDAVALTDHNTCLNCPAAVSLGKEAGVVVVPGMELCTAEEVHIVCLFGSVENALAFSDYVAGHSMKVKNKPEIFGNQIIMNEKDEVTGEYENLLITASNITVSTVKSRVSEFGGVCYPAHIDRDSYSVISNLGAITREMDFDAAEISDSGDFNALCKKFPVLDEIKILRSSDAHNLQTLCREAQTIELEEASVKAILEHFGRNGSSRKN